MGIIIFKLFLMQSPVDIAEKINVTAEKLTLIGLLAIIAGFSVWYIVKLTKAEREALRTTIKDHKEVIIAKDLIIKEKDDYIIGLIEIIRQDNDNSNKVAEGVTKVLNDTVNKVDGMEEKISNKILLAIKNI